MFGKLLVKASEWVFKVVRANLYWLCFTISGGVIFGFFPATIALARLIRQWQIDDTTATFSFMHKEFQRHFKMGNQIGSLYFISLVAIVVNLKIATYFHHLMFSIASYTLLFALALWFISLTYLFPLIAYYEVTILTYLKQTLVLAFYNIRLLLIQLLGLFLIWYLTLELPALLLFGTVTIWQLYTNRCSTNLFSQVEQINTSKV